MNDDLAVSRYSALRYLQYVRISRSTGRAIDYDGGAMEIGRPIFVDSGFARPRFAVMLDIGVRLIRLEQNKNNHA
ncbi:MAG: hypothetical protein AAGE05_05360 [Pseudomonadota bacterium]